MGLHVHLLIAARSTGRALSKKRGEGLLEEVAVEKTGNIYTPPPSARAKQTAIRVEVCE